MLERVDDLRVSISRSIHGRNRGVDIFDPGSGAQRIAVTVRRQGVTVILFERIDMFLADRSVQIGPTDGQLVRVDIAVDRRPSGFVESRVPKISKRMRRPFVRLLLVEIMPWAANFGRLAIKMSWNAPVENGNSWTSRVRFAYCF